ncbi:hypothetical protein D3C72_2290380 [compost metagenome]
MGESWELIEGDYELRRSKKAYLTLYQKLIRLMAKEQVLIAISNEGASNLVTSKIAKSDGVTNGIGLTI